MKKKIIVVLFAIVICLYTVIPAFAANDGYAAEYSRVNDMADILTEDEEESLRTTLDEISLRQNVDVTIATVNDLNGYNTVSECADAIYELCNYGYGDSKDGILLLISMDEHDWAVSTCGFGITAFTDAGIEYIGGQIKSDLSDGKYAEAFNTYAGLCDEFITQAKNGSPYDSGHLPRKPLSVVWIPVSIAIGFILALIVVGVMKGKLKTVHSRPEADSYIRKGSFDVTESSDLFLYHTLTRTKKEKKENAQSSTHTSSSGTTHGGGSGKF